MTRTASTMLAPALLILATTWLVGCPPETPVPSKPDCVKNTDCKGLADDLSRLCKNGKCVDCATAADCTADYGAAAVCVAGQCTSCVDGETGCACLDGQYCIEGAGCEEGTCQPCTRGAAGCPCDGSTCSDGLSCAEGVCVPAGCAAGSDGCTCGVDDTCDKDLVCGEGTCHACPVTTEGCPCNQGACDIDLVCDDETQRCRAATSCSELDCGTNRLCDNSGGQYHCLDACASGYRWNSTLEQCEPIPHANCDAGAEASIQDECTGKHRTCVEETAGAHCGPCLATVDACFIGPDLEVDGPCRAAVTCPDCTAQHRDCTAATGCGDAVCGACSVGFHDEAGTCVAHTYTACSDCTSCPACSDAHRACISDAGGVYCGDCLPHWTDVSGTCQPVPNCEVGADNSIAQTCADAHKECVEATALADAHCGDCLPSYLYDVTNDLCVPNTPCQSDEQCPTSSGYHCIQLDVTNAAYCRQTTCQGTQVWDRYAQICKTCSLGCTDGPAMTGALWPVTDRNGNCYCETRPGYFWDSSTSGGVAVECDYDGDDWVNQKVYQIRVASLTEYGVASQDDWTPIINARCDLKAVYDFVLVNEWGQTYTVDVSETFSSDTGGRDHVVLYETTRNDRDEGNQLPVYGGRKFAPAEVNSLTKACMDSPIDLNQNVATDVHESHNGGTGEAWQKVFNKMSYFTELMTGYYHDGAYYIVERSRCDPDFPLGYSALDAETSDDYWRSCSRRRDSGYDLADLTSYDFAEYDCAASNEECSYTWDPAWRPRISPATPEPPVPIDGYTEIPPHGVCDGLALTDEPWRGMTHHSQFRCAILRGTADPGAPNEVLIADVTYLNSDPTPTAVHRDYHLNRCGFADAAATDITCEQVLDATAINGELSGRVAWFARSYLPYDFDSEYRGGCINEWVEWRQMCPGFLDSSDPDATIKGAGQNNRFGALTCGCDYNYGGLACDKGCPGQNPLAGSSYNPATGPSYLFLSPGYQLVPRQGYWLCGAVQASEGTPLAEDPDAGTGYSLRGYVPAQVTATTSLCQNPVDGGCAEAGYAIRPSLLP